MRPSPERRQSPSRRIYPRGSTTPNSNRNTNHAEGPTPICRCRVLYLGSAVPHVTKDGLQGIQEPLKELYPEKGALGAKGIDSWLSVWSNGFLLENIDENRKKVTRFFPVESLHYCAAVRYVLVQGSTPADQAARFLPLDSPFARNPNINHPPLFAAILRRTSGIKVLECHVFICKRETAANALVRCSFHAYADSTYARHLEINQSLSVAPVPDVAHPPLMTSGVRPETPAEYRQSVIEMSEDSINSIEKVEEWNVSSSEENSSPKSSRIPFKANGRIGHGSPKENGNASRPGDVLKLNIDENHKVWIGKDFTDSPDGIYESGGTTRSMKSSGSLLSQRNRPRQMVMPSSPPPPPIPEEGPPLRAQNEKKKKRRSLSRDSLDNRKSNPANGSGGSGSGVGQVNGRGSQWVHPLTSKDKGSGFFGRQKVPVGPSAPVLFYGAPSPSPFGFQYGPPFTGFLSPNGRPLSRPAEEPTYFTHYGRPMSPLATYRPAQFPHEAYFSQEMYAHPDKPKSNRYKKGKSASKNQQSSDSNAEDSEFGISGAAPHLRNGLQLEHRSKSQGSLAQAGGYLRQNSKEELELLRMMGDLSPADDDPHEIPPGLFPPGHPPNSISGGQFSPFLPLPPPPHSRALRVTPTDLQRRKR